MNAVLSYLKAYILPAIPHCHKENKRWTKCYDSLNQRLSNTGDQRRNREKMAFMLDLKSVDVFNQWKCFQPVEIEGEFCCFVYLLLFFQVEDIA